MNSGQQEKGGRRELQGPRPAPLNISKDSHKIRKPPLPQPQPAPPIQYKPPVIIHLYSPKIIHTDAGGFMTLVQRLTGRAAATAADSQSQSQDSRKPSPCSPAASRFQPSQVSGVPYEYPNSRDWSQLPSESPNLRVSHRSISVPREESVHSVPNPAEFSGNNQPDPWLPSPNIPSGLFSPLSPSMFLPSPRHLSPNIFQDFPLFTPQSNYFMSPSHILYRQSESLFTPPFRPSINVFSPSPAGGDIFNTPHY